MDMRIKNILIYDSIWGLLDNLTDPQVAMLFRAIKSWKDGYEPQIEDPLIKGVWLGILPNLNNLEDNYNNIVERNRENGKKGGRPKTQTTQHNPNNPSGFNKTQKTQKTQNNPNNLKEKEKEKDKEKERDKEMENEAAAPQFKLHQFKKETDEDLELFGYMFNEFNEPDSKFDELFDMWFKLPQKAQEDSVSYSTRFIKYCKEKKMKINLYYYLLDEKYNWESIRKIR